MVAVPIATLSRARLRCEPRLARAHDLVSHAPRVSAAFRVGQAMRGSGRQPEAVCP